MRIKKLTILVLFLLLLFLYGCRYHIFDKNQVKVIKYSVPNFGYFCPIFFQGKEVVAQQGQDTPRDLTNMTLYSSKDFKKYNKIALFEDHFGQFYVSPYNSKEIFFMSTEGKEGTEQIVFKSNDGGKSWGQVYYNSDDSMMLADMTFSPSNRNEIFLVKNDKEHGIEIIESHDSGIHWSKANSTKEIIMSTHLVIDPNNSKHFLVSASNGLWESIDGGVSWKQITTSESLTAIFALSKNDNVYFTTRESINEGCIYELNNGKIKKISIPNMGELIYNVGIAYQNSTGKVYVIVIRQNESNSMYDTTLYYIKNDSFNKVTNIKSKYSTLPNLIFDATNSNVIYFYSYKNIYKVVLS
ncbi:WD40/YVTN/BNR-like repeat-containing protein [Thermoanaerobacterium thermosaccharolyticum]|uniref:WD40/YVTN/BNR-like repeat-containing protein n=1 Tax=Thermoanaerobacterium thermosaccharolyticum TaxID=1517 RepID=UPI0004B535D4|nr:exo-alpha-sialidase [Thermoanaerobacterium thermosaccharolyticum]KAA5806165.1 hypothetical protein F1655_10785 [Thermoanaerobacterium thermosaccharolyticum]MBE0068716.1 hypothetical protein [Thermoanaerobacterium thermosaccharolyticum]MBE0228304.1 hypothetical protein [Thermoanaerobacterium thermosaccharolyticum]